MSILVTQRVHGFHPPEAQSRGAVFGAITHGNTEESAMAIEVGYISEHSAYHHGEVRHGGRSPVCSDRMGESPRWFWN